MTYKKKFRLLLIAAGVLLLLSYTLAIKKTVALFTDCNSMEKKLEMIGEAPKNIEDLNKKIAEIDGMISISDTSTMDFRQLLLEKTGDYCTKNNITLKQFPSSVFTIQNDYIIETNAIVMEGAFKSLLSFTYQLEQQYKIGKVVSVEFSSKFDIAAKTNKLTEKIFVQHIKKKTDETAMKNDVQPN